MITIFPLNILTEYYNVVFEYVFLMKYYCIIHALCNIIRKFFPKVTSLGRNLATETIFEKEE